MGNYHHKKLSIYRYIEKDNLRKTTKHNSKCDTEYFLLQLHEQEVSLIGLIHQRVPVLISMMMNHLNDELSQAVLYQIPIKHLDLPPVE